MVVTEDPRLAALCQLLQEQHGCHTVILYGSRARGDATAISDYDLAGFRAGGDLVRDARWQDGAYLDLFIYPDSTLGQPDASHLKLLDGKVLLELDGAGSRFLAALDTLHQAGPPTLPADEVAVRQAWPAKMLQRAAQGDPEGHYRRHWLLMALLEDYFALRNRWYLGPKRALAWLAEHDPAFHQAFSTALQPNASLAEIAIAAELAVQL